LNARCNCIPPPNIALLENAHDPSSGRDKEKEELLLTLEEKEEEEEGATLQVPGSATHLQRRLSGAVCTLHTGLNHCR
jgi:hypothetical protein